LEDPNPPELPPDPDTQPLKISKKFCNSSQASNKSKTALNTKAAARKMPIQQHYQVYHERAQTRSMVVCKHRKISMQWEKGPTLGLHFQTVDYFVIT
jgi:hypothetical protein